MANIHQDNPFLKLKARSLFLWCFIFIFITGFVSKPLISYTHFKQNDPILTYVYYCLIFGLLVLWLLRRCHQLQINVKHLIGDRLDRYRWLALVSLVIAILLFSTGAFLLSCYFLGLIAPSFLASLLKSLSSEQSKVSAFPIIYKFLETFSLVFVAPLTEEFIFRGVLLHRWAAKWGITQAILASSILFGCLHANPVGLSVFGIVMALLYINTRTLLVPMAAHAMNNTIASAVLLLSPQSTHAPQHYPATTYLWSGLVCVALSAPFLMRFIFKKWPNQRVVLPYFANASP